MTHPEQIASVFPEFSDGLIHFLASISRVRKLTEEETVFLPGEKPEYAILVLSGRLKIMSQELNHPDTTAWLYDVESGKACALSLFCIQGSASSRMLGIAGTLSEILLIPNSFLAELSARFPEWQNFVAQVYRSRFSELIEAFEQIAFKSLDERLVHYLVRKSKALKSDLIPLTHEQIAQDLNSSRVVISRLLKIMEKDGKVKLLRQAVVLVRTFWPKFN